MAEETEIRNGLSHFFTNGQLDSIASLHAILKELLGVFVFRCQKFLDVGEVKNDEMRKKEDERKGIRV